MEDKRVSQSEIDDLTAQQTALKNEIDFQEKQRDYAQSEYEKNINAMKHQRDLSNMYTGTAKANANQQVNFYRQRSISDKRNKQNAIDNIRTSQAELDEVNERLNKLNADVKK